MTITVRILSETLSDDSLVYGVEIWQGDSILYLPAVSEPDAMVLADKLVEAIKTHTNEALRRI